MKKDIYEELRMTFDQLSFGFPKAKFGIEKKLLKKFFDKDDARYFCDMEPKKYQTWKDYAQRNNLDEAEAQRRLELLAGKGLIFRKKSESGPLYRMYPFLFGLVEFQAHRADTSWKMPLGLYMALSSYTKQMAATMPFYRSVPFNREFVEGSEVLPYDDIETVVARHKTFAVTTCMCRLLMKTKPGNKCQHPMETCIMTDDYAEFLIENGWGRQISADEAFEIMMAGKEDGRVINITNSQDSESICSCCSCGCGMLYLKSKYPGPSADYWSNYFCVTDTEKCVGCGLCVKACPVKAISMRDKKAVINIPACLGCGVCGYKCKTGALKLKRKDADKIYTPPETYDDAMEIWEKITPKS